MAGHEFGPRDDIAAKIVVDALACPTCRSGMQSRDTQLVCDSGHAFNVARQGYASLMGGGRRATTGDNALMTAARAAFLATGHYRRIADAVTRSIPESAQGLCLDLAGGTGYYLSAVLDVHPDLIGLSLDLSPSAAGRAARSHPRVAAVTADAWQRFPLQNGSARCILNIFGPRNGPEMSRVLERGGVLVVATPTARHLEELRRALGLIEVDSRKQERLASQLVDFTRRDDIEVEYVVSMNPADIENDVRMGPNAHHADSAVLDEAIRSLPDPMDVTVSVLVSTYNNNRPAP